MSSNGILDQKSVLLEDQMVAGVWGVRETVPYYEGKSFGVAGCVR